MALTSSELRNSSRKSDFEEFAHVNLARIRRALCSAFGREQGQMSAAYALEYAWRHWDRVRAKRNPPGYVWTVGRNHARRQLRLSRKRSLAEVDSTSHREPWIEPELERALQSLSERERTCVVLVHGFEWTLSEVAALLTVSKGSVQRYVERGVHKLRNGLGVDNG